MGKFILFFRGGVPESFAQEDITSWANGLKQKGHYIDGAPLVADGKIVEKEGIMRDFKFDMHENARAFVIIEAQNFEEAVALTTSCPVVLNGGNVTIRPIREKF